MLRLVFFGTSSFAAQILTYLAEQKIFPAAIVTRPDRPQGRDLHLKPPPVKLRAEELGLSIPLLQPEKVSTEEFAAQLQHFSPDLFIVVAFGEILKESILSIPRLLPINIHASLLPKYRGANPIRRCLMSGERETGITIIEMVKEMDAGPMLGSAHLPIPLEMTFGELEEKLHRLAGPLLVKVVKELEEGRAVKKEQQHALATYAPKFSPEEEIIDWRRSALEIHNLIRALSPKPGASTSIKVHQEMKRLKIRRAELIPSADYQEKNLPGTLIHVKDSWIALCGHGSLELLELQLEGRKNMSAQDFFRGFKTVPSLN